MQPSRLLDATEQLFHENFINHNGNTQVTTLITVSGTVSSGQATRAFNRLVDEYPFLRQRISRCGNDRYGFFEVPRGVYTEPSLLPVSVPVQSDTLLKLELNRLLSDEEAWRAWVVPRHEVLQTDIFVSRNHAISDGYTTARLVDSLINNLALEEDEEESVPGDGRAFHVRLAYWREWPVDTDKVSYADFVRLQVSSRARRHMERLRGSGGWTANDIWGGILAYSFSQQGPGKPFDLYTAYSLRRPDDVAVDPTRACHIAVRKTSLPAMLPDLQGCIELYASVVASGRAELRSGPTARPPADPATASPAGAALAITNTGDLDRMLTGVGKRPVGFTTVVNRSAGNYDFVLHLCRFEGCWQAVLAFSSRKVDRATALELKGLIEAALEALPATALPAVLDLS